MQQYQQYGNYPYYGQPIYPHTPAGPSNGHGYIPFHQPHNAPHIPPGPPPASFDAAAYAPNPAGTSGMPRPKTHRRAVTTPARSNIPLKSALKKTNTVAVAPAAEDLTRTRTNSFNQPTGNTGLGRPRKYSNAAQSSDYHANDYAHPAASLALHMFVSFHGYSEMRLENITELALRELRAVIWPKWTDGVESDTVNNHTCNVRFRNSPWDMSGPKALEAAGFIKELWQLCARRGYSFQTTLDTASPAPRLVFQVVQPDAHSNFFMAYFSQSGRRFTLIDPPEHIDLTLAAELRAILPTNNHSDDSNNRIFELKKINSYGGTTDPAQFLMHVLRILSNLSYDLDASIPLSRKSALGMRSKLELLVFKGTNPTT
ncbi:hypothetical protein BDQ12DRAFT_710985 [Crucibulum laeve]|uniref:Uncharacterized protein n=1 Tax=Crucibulum laeve TaxID=68775 RepID=A0A5C3M6U1_9AGAR|nr:hypothetical protein BDQ12DRAFT_710985 [Crucibulum laeve]